jgi:hypothetical protein
MSKYHVSFTTGAHTVVTVEADTPEEAREIADENFVAPYICAQCSGWGKSADEHGIELGDDWEQDGSESGVWEA